MSTEAGSLSMSEMNLKMEIQSKVIFFKVKINCYNEKID